MNNDLNLIVMLTYNDKTVNNAYKIFDKLWNHDDGVRSVCVFISGLSNVRKKQLSIFDMDNGSNDSKDNEKVQKLIDEMQSKYGKNIINYANMKENDKNE